MKLKIVVSQYYEANPKNYGTDDPNEAAAIDYENLINGSMTFDDVFNVEDADIHIRSVGENG